MKKNHLPVLACSLFILVSANAYAQEHGAMSVNLNADNQHVMLNESKLKWMPGPASLPPGTKMSVLEGDLSKPGPFTIRLQIPANFRIGPHFHPAIEHVTVVDGNFYMGTGKEYNEAAATQIKKGGFAVMPVGFAHFATIRPFDQLHRQDKLISLPVCLLQCTSAEHVEELVVTTDFTIDIEDDRVVPDHERIQKFM